ncbi:hypothetical protein TorRG33x02_334170 [Trema orientale]|uniref:Uncharacterized protein n=1 Tax=Trema orientale TaxID=63057 RepID=A0A2P5B317_TREOI|nr:hypothetical protein TorRG33x02_334170 [Trema orientale]
MNVHSFSFQPTLPAVRTILLRQLHHHHHLSARQPRPDPRATSTTRAFPNLLPTTPKMVLLLLISIEV